MSLTKRPNRPPNTVEVTTLNKLIAQEEEILAAIQRLEREREKERGRLFNKSSLLQRTLQSAKVIQDIVSQMCSSNAPLLKKLEKEVDSQDADATEISACFPSTGDFIKGLKSIARHFKRLHSELQGQVQCIGDRIN